MTNSLVNVALDAKIQARAKPVKCARLFSDNQEFIKI
jgi:hypothetical protein